MAESQLLPLLSSTASSELLQNGVTAVLSDDGFKIGSSSASRALKTAEELSLWILHPENQLTVSAFATQMSMSLTGCFVAEGYRSEKHRRERMWGQYHKLRTSDGKWQRFLETATSTPPCPIFYQHVTDAVFKQIIVKQQYPIQRAQNSEGEGEVSLTFEETNGLRYAAGYVPRALKKKLRKSAHPLKSELTLCILDMLDDGDEEHDSSCKWIDMIDRGGLTHVNTVTYHAFLLMEVELRKHLGAEPLPSLKDVAKIVKDSDDVQFYWSMVAADWEEEEAQGLLELVVDLWITIRGFSFASTWMEKFKAEHKKSVQKSKGVRKQLCAPASSKK